MFSQKSLRTKISVDTEAGLIIGYKITKPIYEPVLKMASKGRKGWSQPTFLESLVHNPAPLILSDRWLFDMRAVSNALETLRSKKVMGTEKLEHIFNSSDCFEAITFEDLIDTVEDIEIVLEVMAKCSDPDFGHTILPLKKCYGTYAWPNNYEFERMNAGFFRALSRKYPHIVPLDDSLRAPVYEYLGDTIYSEAQKKREQLGQILEAAHNTYNPLIYAPKFGEDWDPEDFIKIHKSKGAKQLREIANNIRTTTSITSEKLEEYVKDSREKAMSLSPIRDVTYAIAGFGGAALSATAVIAQPYLFIPSYMFAAITGHQLLTAFQQFSATSELKWVGVADQMASWAKRES